MVLPVGTDQYTWRTPVATLTIIALSVLAYTGMLLVERHSGTSGLQGLLAAGALSRSKFQFWQPVSYQFMHDPGSIMHLAGNMLFLWIFGTAVEARLRAAGFALLYLAGGAVAGAVQLFAEPGSIVIGASGAVSAVTGAFIVLFPRARVTIFMLLALVPVPAMLLVVVYLALDLLGAAGLRDGGVAYVAHLAGLAFGVVAAAALLMFGIVRRTDMDMVYLIKQWRRRAEMRRVLRSHDARNPWQGAPPPARTATTGATPAKTAASATHAAPHTAPGAAVNPRLAARWVADASAAYQRGEFVEAAAAYERALAAAPDAKDADETRLILAVIFCRKTKEWARAREQLKAIGPGLPEHLRPLAAALRVEAAP